MVCTCSFLSLISFLLFLQLIIDSSSSYSSLFLFSPPPLYQSSRPVSFFLVLDCREDAALLYFSPPSSSLLLILLFQFMNPLITISLASLTSHPEFFVCLVKVSITSSTSSSIFSIPSSILYRRLVNSLDWMVIFCLVAIAESLSSIICDFILFS